MQQIPILESGGSNPFGRTKRNRSGNRRTYLRFRPKGFETKLRIFRARSAGKIREKAPVGLSIVEKRIPSGATYEPLRRAILRLRRTACLRAKTLLTMASNFAAPPHHAPARQWKRSSLQGTPCGSAAPRLRHSENAQPFSDILVYNPLHYMMPYYGARKSGSSSRVTTYSLL